MNKLLYAVLLSISLFLSLPQVAQASQTRHILYEGYTDEGVHYTVYAENDTKSQSVQTYSPSYYQYVERQIYFDGIVTPPQTMYFDEYIHGYRYAGSLTLYSISCQNNRTLAEYHGKLYIIG